LPLTAVYDSVGFHSAMWPLVTFEVKVFLRVVQQCEIIVVHCSCILVSEQQIFVVQLCSLST